MKIRYVFVAIVLAAAAACHSSPTASRTEDSRSATDINVRLDGATTPTDSTSRTGSGWAGSGT